MKNKSSYIFFISDLVILWIICCIWFININQGTAHAYETAAITQKATEEAPSPSKSAADDKAKADLSVQEPSITHHSITINGKTLKYTATAGYLRIQDESNKPLANIFFISYEKEDQQDKTKRPVTFAFNGGPGASSIYLHLGALGPKRSFLKDEGNNAAPPYKLIDNEYTWLTFTDLIFIDPVGTGYSRSDPNVDQKKFYDVKEDIKLIGDFIRLYITKYKRWTSPKFLAGESYGTTRACGLSSHLQDSLNINLNGLILISPVLDFRTIIFDPGNDLPYSLYLPSYTATAWYHKRLPDEMQSKDLPGLIDEAESWALNEYYLALLKGSELPGSEYSQLIKKLAAYTGLSPSFIERKNMRIDNTDFAKALLQDERRVLGIIDSRFKGVDPEPASERMAFDPSLFLLTVPFGATMNDYVREELKYENDLNYEALNRTVNRSWEWDSGIPERQGYVNVIGSLRRAMSRNSYLKIFIASGYYDFATPHFAAKYTINHLDIDPSLRNNITLSLYESGHQIYVHIPSLEKLTADVTAFIKKAIPD